MSLTLEKAQTIIAAAFQKGGELAMKPLSVAVLDAGGHVVSGHAADEPCASGWHGEGEGAERE